MIFLKWLTGKKTGVQMVDIEAKINVLKVNGSTVPMDSKPKLLIKIIGMEPENVILEFNGAKVTIGRMDFFKAVKGLMG